jgi:hypothetical protein
MQPTTAAPAWLSCPESQAEYGRRELLGLRAGEGELGETREQFFGAGHAEAGLALVPSPKA